MNQPRCPNFDTGEVLLDEAAQVDRFRDLYNYGTILIASHGTLGKPCFELKESDLQNLRQEEMPQTVWERLRQLQGKRFCDEGEFWQAIQRVLLEPGYVEAYQELIRKYAQEPQYQLVTGEKITEESKNLHKNDHRLQRLSAVVLSGREFTHWMIRPDFITY